MSRLDQIVASEDWIVCGGTYLQGSRAAVRARLLRDLEANGYEASGRWDWAEWDRNGQESSIGIPAFDRDSREEVTVWVLGSFLASEILRTQERLHAA